MLEILKPCQREVKAFPTEIREDLADAVARLELGQTLSLPLSRPMPSLGKGIHELRLKDRSGIYRIIYFIIRANKIILVHAFKKTTQETPLQVLNTAKRRIKEVKI